MEQAQYKRLVTRGLSFCGCLLGGPHRIFKTNFTIQTPSNHLPVLKDLDLLRLPRKKKGIAMAAASHPKYIDMVLSAIKALAEKSGSSRQAINKYVVKEYKLTENNHHNAMLKQALQRGSGPNGPLVHNKGTGAAGSFKIKPAPTKPAKPAKKKPPAKTNAPKKAAKPAKPVATSAEPELKPVTAPVLKKPAKPTKAKVTREKSAKKSKAASPKKPKVVKAKRSPKKPAKKPTSKK